MNNNPRGVALTVLTAALALTVTACGSQEADVKSDRKPTTQPSVRVDAGSASPAEPTVAGGISVRKNDKLENIVVDSEGMTTYVFAKDETTPGKSSCSGPCAETWPPVPADGATAGKGLNQDLLGSITRSDGSKQLTLAGKPLYSYAKDDKAGDTNGQGVNKAWYAAAPDGAKAGVERPVLGVLDDPKLGRVLQDKDGRTLYLFTKDTPWPMKTACDAKCQEQWTPTAPVTAADAEAAGLDPKLLFTFTTPDGVKQESFNCWPAYTFKGDTQPGQTNGQAVGGVWFAIKAEIPESDRGKTVPAAKG